MGSSFPHLAVVEAAQIIRNDALQNLSFFYYISMFDNVKKSALFPS